MTVKKLSISLPNKLLEILDAYAKKNAMSRSKAIAQILSVFFREDLFVEEGKYPTVLWRLEMTGGLRLRSPRRVGRRFTGEWIVEEFKT